MPESSEYVKLSLCYDRPTGGDHLWPGPVIPEVDGWKCFNLNNPGGQVCQHHRQVYIGRSHLLCGVVHVHIHGGDGDGLGAVLAGFIEECRTPGLEMSQFTWSRFSE